ncbi:MAG TPA: hypothetical protein VGR07_02105 [Thermoanaerobaculia bacterium]|jgi:hypothetical protein|nr:hypothetical protein [Thermoanaerobaculia bacterium]
MSSRKYRRATAVALLAGSLGLLPVTAHAAPSPHPASSSGRVVAASPSLFDSLWSRLVSLWAGDHHEGDVGNDGNYDGSGHGGHHPHTDEGPGICPHGH